jgi:prepilin-type N-terminal cleavage/methylation domain-containing protein
MIALVRQAGFTLVELLIVVVILGILATVVLPLFLDTSNDAKLTTLKANLAIMRQAIERYCIQHPDHSPDKDENGNDDPDNAPIRFTSRTFADGRLDANGPLGPYMSSIPINPFNDKSDVRIGGAPAGAGTHGWHVDTSNGRFSADDSAEHAEL